MLVIRGPGANVLAADTDEGVVLVDGGHENWSGSLLETVATHFPGRPMRALINTHWHEEQTGSNLTLGERGVEIIAHENTALWLGTEVWVRWSNEIYPALPPAARPTTTFYEPRSLRLAERTVDCGYMLNAHTDGDIWAHFPDENVLVTGGAVSNQGWPVIDWWTGGWIAGMLDGYDALLETADEQTRIVPAVGPVMTLAELREQQRMYLTIFERLEEMLRKADSTEEVLAAKPTAEYDARWGDPEQFLTLAFHSMWEHLRDAYDRRMRNIA
jgi:glyoxylase-like metal-dependent hydrolase (beta-lactamase superfamily II)